jgi:ABC-2 type transport system ATP-binding protein
MPLTCPTPIGAVAQLAEHRVCNAGVSGSSPLGSILVSSPDPSQKWQTLLAQDSSILFQLDGVTKTYGALKALNDLSFSVPVGAIGLLGPNGSGKTTMIRSLLGLIPVDAGTGQILGMDIRRQQLDIRRAVGFAPEDECLFPRVEGVGFVAYAGELVGMHRKDAMQRAHEVLDYVGLGEARYRMVETYSTGMKQRLKLAAAIVHDPKMVILDEPTNGMDPAGREEVLQLARDLTHNKGMSLLFSSHLLPDVEAVCDHILVMAGGKLLTQGNIQQLKEVHSLCFEVRLKSDAAAFTERLMTLGCSTEARDDLLLVRVPQGGSARLLWKAASEQKIQIRHLRPQRSTLEEVFLKAVEQT